MFTRLGARLRPVTAAGVYTTGDTFRPSQILILTHSTPSHRPAASGADLSPLLLQPPDLRRRPLMAVFLGHLVLPLSYTIAFLLDSSSLLVFGCPI